MADYTTDIESKAWFRVKLRTPTNGAEFAKAMICAEQEYERRNGHKSEWDNDFEVLSSEDEIIIRFEIEETRT